MITQNKKLILFYTNTARAFRTTLIGYLYELAQTYDVILLSEELDEQSTRIIRNKSLFPGIIKIIPTHQYTGTRSKAFRQNRYLSKLAKDVVHEYQPHAIIASSDWHSIFEMYLMRYATRINALKVTFQDTFNIAEMDRVRLWIDLNNAYLKTPGYLPHIIRMTLIRTRKYLAHFIYYWILPLFALEYPFHGNSSYILSKGHSGIRESDYHIVLSERDYNIHVKSGVPADKLLILQHPIARDGKYIFNQVISLGKLKQHCNKSLVIMLPAEENGFNKSDLKPIPVNERIQTRKDILLKILNILPDFDIYVKPHPSTSNYGEIKLFFETISSRIKVAYPNEPADIYIDIANVVMELPRAASTTLFTANFRCPEKPILAIDFHRELLGDCYSNFPGIEYVDNMEHFVDILKKIRDQVYSKETYLSETKPAKQYTDASSLLEYLFFKKRNYISKAKFTEHF